MSKYTFKHENTTIFGSTISTTEKIVNAEEYSTIFEEITNFLKTTGCSLYTIKEYYLEEIQSIEDEINYCLDQKMIAENCSIEEDECND
jgi:methylaspartate ammonia-lyase